MCALTKQNPHHKPLPLNNASAYYSSAQFTQQPLQNIYAHTSTQRPTDRQQLACLFVIALVHKTHTHTHLHAAHNCHCLTYAHARTPTYYKERTPRARVPVYWSADWKTNRKAPTAHATVLLVCHCVRTCVFEWRERNREGE